MGSRRRTRTARLCVAAVLLASALLTGCGGDDSEETAGPPDFGYSGKSGPENWGTLDPSYRACSDGRRQSPIDLTGARASSLPPIRFSYEPAAVEVENNGHSLEVVYPQGSSVEIGGTEYELDQFHFHSPSEHHVNGSPLPMEFHFVNRAGDDTVAVLGVLVAEGEANPTIAKLAPALPGEEGEALPTPGEINALDLLPPDPESAARWTYEGSFTTPPCTEGVSWNVFREPIELSASQIASLREFYDGNNRPVQPLNGRELLAGE
jgi:carbonic anhydrase